MELAVEDMPSARAAKIIMKAVWQKRSGDFSGCEDSGREKAGCGTNLKFVNENCFHVTTS